MRGANAAETAVTDLRGARVLVVEDDFLVAESMRRMLSTLGCEVVGPAFTTEEACRLIEDEPIDAALLDIRLGPESSEAAARALLDRDRSFVFVTGYGSPQNLPDDLREHPRLRKPVTNETLRACLGAMVRTRSTSD